MKGATIFPDWLLKNFRVALLGEIYPAIRAIAVSEKGGNIAIKYYLDRPVSDFDKESIEVVATNLEASLPMGTVKSMRLDCEYSLQRIADMDPLDGFVYVRREYELQDNLPGDT